MLLWSSWNAKFPLFMSIIDLICNLTNPSSTQPSRQVAFLSVILINLCCNWLIDVWFLGWGVEFRHSLCSQGGQWGVPQSHTQLEWLEFCQCFRTWFGSTIKFHLAHVREGCCSDQCRSFSLPIFAKMDYPAPLIPTWFITIVINPCSGQICLWNVTYSPTPTFLIEFPCMAWTLALLRCRPPDRELNWSLLPLFLHLDDFSTDLGFPPVLTDPWVCVHPPLITLHSVAP